MPGVLPAFLDIAQGARRGLRVEGRLPVAQLPRLAASLASDRGEVLVDLSMDRDAGGQPMVSGHIETEVELVCQRCLGSVRLPIRTDTRLAWVRTEEEAGSLPEEYDPLVAADGRVALADLVADELLLALPIVPRHAPGERCEEPAAVHHAEPTEESKRPFAGLAALKRER